MPRSEDKSQIGLRVTYRRVSFVRFVFQSPLRNKPVWGGGVEEFFCDIYQFLLPYAYLDNEMVCQMFYELKP